MPNETVKSGTCPKCEKETVNCKYNLFEGDDLRIDSWEHKCMDCGHRQTHAYRSDDEDLEPDVETTICPYCGRKPGI